jgi:hypothetical protein
MCYYIETIEYDDPLFHAIDATYILHLEQDTSRYEDIQRQLKLYHPTKIVHLVFNKGFKQCDKPGVTSTLDDIFATNLFIMNDAKKYNHILVLEDDFMFRPDIKQHTHNIDSFVSTHSHFIYRLGCLPYLQLPYNSYTYVGLSDGSHAVVYSKSIREKMHSSNMDWDKYITWLSPNYLYYKPLCYQLVTATENQKNWGNENRVATWLVNFQIFYYHMLKLDKQVEPGYTFKYTFSKIISLLLLALLFYLLKFYLTSKKSNR